MKHRMAALHKILIPSILSLTALGCGAGVDTDYLNTETNSSTGIGYYTSDGIRIGTYIGPIGSSSYLVILSGGGLLLLDAANAYSGYMTSLAAQTVPVLSQFCLYTTPDCSGSCYLDANDVGIKGAIVYDGVQYRRITGNESNQTLSLLSYRSFDSGGSPGPCDAYSSSDSVFTPGESYQFPYGKLPPYVGAYVR